MLKEYKNHRSMLTENGEILIGNDVTERVFKLIAADDG
jgi:hypothetical protein